MDLESALQMPADKSATPANKSAKIMKKFFLTIVASLWLSYSDMYRPPLRSGKHFCGDCLFSDISPFSQSI
jgi:hypothetical protein